MSLQAKITDEYAAWFTKLQALTNHVLEPDDWVERWFDHYTPQEALEAGPEKDEDE